MAVYHVKADVKEFFSFLFCGHLPLSPLQLCRLFTYDTYVIPKCMENALSNRKWGYNTWVSISPAGIARTHQTSEQMTLNDQLGITNERYYRDYMSIYAKYNEADGHKTLNSEILQTI